MFRKPRKPISLNAFKSWHNDMEFGSDDFPTELLSSALKVNLDFFCQKFNQSTDFSFRNFEIHYQNRQHPAALLFIDGLADKKQIESSILSPLLIENPKLDSTIPLNLPLFEYLEKRLITAGGVKYENNLDNIVSALLAGSTILLIDQYNQGLNFSTAGWEKRSLTEPETEIVIRGPRLGFNETLRVNTALLRRIINNPELTFETFKIGKRTQTNICLAYIKSLPSPALLAEVKSRLTKIDTDAVLESGYIEQFIEDAPLSPFPTVGYTERPDVAAAKILEGRVAILVDGSPFCLTVPLMFIESFQNPDDYNSRPFFQTILRWMRYIAFGLSVLSPPTYVALTTFHQELIPTPLLITMMSSSQGTPFPSIVEAIGMGIVFEILQEAGIRLPRPIGQTIGIVGALVIGQAAVSAGFISAPVLIVIAITAISSFVAPSQAASGGFTRFTLTMMAGLLGALGIMLGVLFVMIHLTALRSFGVPYLAPLAPMQIPDLKDVLIRAPLWAMFKRPRSLNIRDLQRQAPNQMPRSDPAKPKE